MALSAFRSTSKRGNLNTDHPKPSSKTSASSKPPADHSPRKAPIRRSRSVCAFSRTQLDYLNKRDNPLFCADNSPPSDRENNTRFSKFDPDDSRFSGSVSKSADFGVLADNRRGRSASRSNDNRVSSGIGRSLSRVDVGRRRRSVSRGPFGNSESEVEHEYGLSSDCRSRSSVNSSPTVEKILGLARSASDLSDHVRSPRTFSTQRPSNVSVNLTHTPNWEDGASTSSLSEVEEKTIKAVFEQMKSIQGDHHGIDTTKAGIYETVRSEVIRALSDMQNDIDNVLRRNNATPILTTANVADLPPNLVNPSAVELVLDIRKEYAHKLEQSQDRARKLRAELTVEEQRGEELNKILKETVPEPKASNVHRSRPGRKTSAERRKMSKRLTEEAMAYFDECVSKSAFDSSDFSAPEDPQPCLVGATTPIGDNFSVNQGSPSISATHRPDISQIWRKELGDPTLALHGHEASCSNDNEPSVNQPSPQLMINTEGPRKFQFSFADRSAESSGPQHNLRHYIKSFSKDIEKEKSNSQIARLKPYDKERCNLQVQGESILFDMVFCKNRIESGSLLLCGGGITSTLSSFPSVI
ncbi:hypothetical protein RJ641_012311 [Dillenia turbinata]|uniref:Uncharacterized protein n=1 Tax=Dillenia turbinata TaxID=194707 RepID=A0AAN8UW45_9MAGN